MGVDCPVSATVPVQARTVGVSTEHTTLMEVSHGSNELSNVTASGDGSSASSFFKLFLLTRNALVIRNCE